MRGIEARPTIEYIGHLKRRPKLREQDFAGLVQAAAMAGSVTWARVGRRGIELWDSERVEWFWLVVWGGSKKCG